ncbi:hypothetical protein OS21_17700 [Dickeya oryzae]
MDNYQQHARTLLKTLWCQILLLSLLLSGARLTMFAVFADTQQLRHYDAAVRLMWLTGLRYDLRAVSILLAPLLVIGLVMSLHRTGWRWVQRIAPWYLGGMRVSGQHHRHHQLFLLPDLPHLHRYLRVRAH